jgi:preprotein translocase subunit YajC
MEGIMTLFPLIILILIMYFLLIRPQKKREKEVNAMRSAIKVGDEIITIGGIYGKVVKTRDDTLTIAVGSDKTKFEVTRWAVSKVVNEQPASNRVQKDSAPEKEAEPVKKSLPKRMKKASGEASVQEEKPAEEPVEVAAEVVEEAEVAEAEANTTKEN